MDSGGYRDSHKHSKRETHRHDSGASQRVAVRHITDQVRNEDRAEQRVDEGEIGHVLRRQLISAESVDTRVQCFS